MNRCAICNEVLSDKERTVCVDDFYMLLLDGDMREKYVLEHAHDYTVWLTEYEQDVRNKTIEEISNITSLAIESLRNMNDDDIFKLIAQILYISEDVYHYIDYYVEERRFLWMK